LITLPTASWPPRLPPPPRAASWLPDYAIFAMMPHFILFSPLLLTLS
jgi:hypothetical protein